MSMKKRYKYLLIQHVCYYTNKALYICYQHYYETLLIVTIEIDTLIFFVYKHINTLHRECGIK